MRKLKRSDINGFTIKVKPYEVEVVFIKLLPVAIALTKTDGGAVKYIKSVEI